MDSSIPWLDFASCLILSRDGGVSFFWKGIISAILDHLLYYQYDRFRIKSQGVIPFFLRLPATGGKSVNSSVPELLAEDLRLALVALGRITGRVGVEDMLDKLFAEFCIGK